MIIFRRHPKEILQITNMKNFATARKEEAGRLHFNQTKSQM